MDRRTTLFGVEISNNPKYSEVKFQDCHIIPLVVVWKELASITDEQINQKSSTVIRDAYDMLITFMDPEKFVYLKNA